MSVKKNTILRKDYDFYTIQLPFFVFLKRQKNQFINAQLEKLHPGYSDEFCFKSNLKLDKKGFRTDIIVMNKFLLAEYKNRFPNKKLFLEGLRKTYQNYEIKKNYIFLGILILFLLGLFFLLKTKSETKIAEIDYQKIEENKTPIIEPKDYLNDFFNLVLKNNGKIQNFNYSQKKSSKNISAQLYNVYPEIFDDFCENSQISAVTYKNKIPFLNFNFLQKNFLQIKKVRSDFENTLKDFREILFLGNCNLISENDFLFTFKILSKKETFKILGKITNLLEKSDICISKFVFQIENDENCKIELQIEKDFCFKDGLNLSLITQNENLFNFLQEKSVQKDKISSKIEKNEKITVLKKSENQNGKKIGEILKKDGKKIIFYKTQEGKIIKEEILNEK